MAKSTRKNVYLVAIFCILIFLTNTEVRVAEAKSCLRRSTTWFGICGYSSHCANQCRKWEDAKRGGYCKWDGWGRACFCKFC
ncbi:hypothetical protein PTKIN_Ptkin02bG0195500 [Pterospermum kingtungense]